MESLATFLSADHRDCDAALTRFEDAIRAGDPGAIQQTFDAFHRAMVRHFAREEDALFPTFEAATGNAHGPTAVMRMEHDQMRMVLAQLEAELARGETSRSLAHADTLMVLVQQHNMKEEQILYPMCDQVCGDAAELLARIRGIGED